MRWTQLLFFAVWPPLSMAQLSPGDLAQAHAPLEGLSRCTSCHVIGSKEFGPKCLACHQVLAARIAQGEGLHAGPDFKACQTCHSDHLGRNYAMVQWPEGKEAFDHEKTGFTLKKAHLKLTCEDCHQAKHIQNLPALLAAGKQPDKTFLGLAPECKSCHLDPHLGQFEKNCRSCHDEAAWKPASGFDHELAGFRLEGAHGEVACDKCHPRDLAVVDSDRKAVRFKPLRYDSCTGCHRDPHRESLGNNCSSCHDMKGWRPASGFDHQKTAYPLTGQHGQVDCKKCHSRTSQDVRFDGLAFQSCQDCHRDVHAAKLGADCAGCHQTSGWKKIAAGRFDHDRTAYPLEGLHEKVACTACHPGGAVRKIKRFERCDDCHQDPHAGQFPQKDCRDCHDVHGFQPAGFSSLRHAETSFPLEGAHRATACLACHKLDGPVIKGKPVRRFRFANTLCHVCHEDPHRGSADSYMQPERPGLGCDRCHSTEDWTQSLFDHASTTFPLRGRHRDQDCSACHLAKKGDGQKGHTLQFVFVDQACHACHDDIHAGQFHSAKTCDLCHDSEGWSPDRFDHGRDSRFILEGAHLQTTCTGCHPREQHDGIEFVRFRPLGRTCESCHASEEKRRENH